MSALVVAAVILGGVYAVLQVGAKRVFWLLLGFHLGKRKAKR